MNRVEYMTRLASMLQDIPVEERQEAMKYYNDYFDEAGEENEEKVAAELDSPEKVAAVIKAEIYGRNNTGETKAPVYPAEKEEKDTNNWWKILLIIVGGLFVLSIAGPIVLGVALTVLAVVFSGFIALIAFVIAAGCLAIVGIALFIGGGIYVDWQRNDFIRSWNGGSCVACAALLRCISEDVSVDCKNLQKTIS